MDDWRPRMIKSRLSEQGELLEIVPNPNRSRQIACGEQAGSSSSSNTGPGLVPNPVDPVEVLDQPAAVQAEEVATPALPPATPSALEEQAESSSSSYTGPGLVPNPVDPVEVLDQPAAVQAEEVATPALPPATPSALKEQAESSNSSYTGPGLVPNPVDPVEVLDQPAAVQTEEVATPALPPATPSALEEQAEWSSSSYTGPGLVPNPVEPVEVLDQPAAVQAEEVATPALPPATPSALKEQAESSSSSNTGPVLVPNPISQVEMSTKPADLLSVTDAGSEPVVAGKDQLVAAKSENIATPEPLPAADLLHPSEMSTEPAEMQSDGDVELELVPILSSCVNETIDFADDHVETTITKPDQPPVAYVHTTSEMSIDQADLPGDIGAGTEMAAEPVASVETHDELTAFHEEETANPDHSPAADVRSSSRTSIDQTDFSGGTCAGTEMVGEHGALVGAHDQPAAAPRDKMHALSPATDVPSSEMSIVQAEFSSATDARNEIVSEPIALVELNDQPDAVQDEKTETDLLSSSDMSIEQADLSSATEEGIELVSEPVSLIDERDEETATSEPSPATFEMSVDQADVPSATNTGTDIVSEPVACVEAHNQHTDVQEKEMDTPEPATDAQSFPEMLIEQNVSSRLIERHDLLAAVQEDMTATFEASPAADVQSFEMSIDQSDLSSATNAGTELVSEPIAHFELLVKSAAVQEEVTATCPVKTATDEQYSYEMMIEQADATAVSIAKPEVVSKPVALVEVHDLPAAVQEEETATPDPATDKRSSSGMSIDQVDLSINTTAGPEVVFEPVALVQVRDLPADVQGEKADAPEPATDESSCSDMSSGQLNVSTDTNAGPEATSEPVSLVEVHDQSAAVRETTSQQPLATDLQADLPTGPLIPAQARTIVSLACVEYISEEMPQSSEEEDEDEEDDECDQQNGHFYMTHLQETLRILASGIQLRSHVSANQEAPAPVMQASDFLQFFGASNDLVESFNGTTVAACRSAFSTLAVSDANAQVVPGDESFGDGEPEGEVTPADEDDAEVPVSPAVELEPEVPVDDDQIQVVPDGVLQIQDLPGKDVQPDVAPNTGSEVATPSTSELIQQIITKIRACKGLPGGDLVPQVVPGGACFTPRAPIVGRNLTAPPVVELRLPADVQQLVAAPVGDEDEDDEMQVVPEAEVDD